MVPGVLHGPALKPLPRYTLLLFCRHPQEKREKKEELGTFERAGSLRSSINSLQLDRTVSTRSSKKKKLVDPIEQRRSIIQMPELESHPPIPVDGFVHKLSVLEECERQLFIEEFAVSCILIFAYYVLFIYFVAVPACTIHCFCHFL